MSLLLLSFFYLGGDPSECGVGGGCGGGRVRVGELPAGGHHRQHAAVRGVGSHGEKSKCPVRLGR